MLDNMFNLQSEETLKHNFRLIGCITCAAFAAGIIVGLLFFDSSKLRGNSRFTYSGKTDLTDLEAYCYLQRHQDLQNAFKEDLSLAKKHWIEFGRNENKKYSCDNVVVNSYESKLQERLNTQVIYEDRFIAEEDATTHRLKNSLFKHNYDLILKLLKCLEQSIVIVPAQTNVDVNFGIFQCQRLKHVDYIQHQHAADIWIPFILKNHPNTSDLLHPTSPYFSKSIDRNNSQPPLFYYIESHFYIDVLCMEKDIPEDWRKLHQGYQLIMQIIFPHPGWFKADGHNFIMTSSHPCAPQSTFDWNNTITEFGHVSNFVTDFDANGHYPRDFIIPYYANSFTKLNLRQHNRSLLLMFVSNPTQLTRRRILDQYSKLNISDVLVIPHTISDNEYLSNVQKSKFCLMVRGDTSSSSRLFHVINAGCIPVLVSNWLIYMLPYSRFIDYAKFSIVVEENFVMHRPESFIRLLRDISLTEYAMKQRFLAIAQRMLPYDSGNALNPTSMAFLDVFVRKIEFCSNVWESLPEKPANHTSKINESYHDLLKSAYCEDIRQRLEVQFGQKALHVYHRLQRGHILL